MFLCGNSFLEKGSHTPSQKPSKKEKAHGTALLRFGFCQIVSR